MKRKIHYVLVLILTMGLMTGCWDQKLLKDTRFILAITLDKEEDGKITGTYSSPNAKSYPKSTILTTVEGHTIRDLTLGVADKVSETLDTSRLRMIFFSEKIAKEDGIFPYLDISLRDPNNPLQALLAITKGDAKDYLIDPIPGEGIPSEYYKYLLESGHDRAILPKVNVLLGSRIFHNEGNDMLLPYLSKSKDKTPKIEGLALFNGGTFTGEILNQSESILYNIMNGAEINAQPELIEKIFYDNEPNIENYVSLNISDADKKMDIEIKEGKVTGNIIVHLDAEIIESPKKSVVKNRKEMSMKLERKLNEHGNEVIRKLQEANCDGLSFGRYLMAFQNKDFKKLNWKDGAFKEADVTVKFTIRIAEHGLIS